MTAPRIPSAQELDNLREHLRYDTATGVVRWAVQRQRRAAGDLAGYLSDGGYYRVNVCRRRYALHRVAWFLAKGQWPVLDLDHINGDKADNRVENLREAAKCLNAQNKHAPLANNKVGVMGVTLCKQTGLYRAQIMAQGKAHWIGRYPTVEEARAARLAAKRRLHEGGKI